MEVAAPMPRAPQRRLDYRYRHRDHIEQHVPQCIHDFNNSCRIGDANSAGYSVCGYWLGHLLQREHIAGHCHD